ncbi:hypothetical protein RFI_34544, partial [Reticulomyxa filosa]
MIQRFIACYLIRETREKFDIKLTMKKGVFLKRKCIKQAKNYFFADADKGQKLNVNDQMLSELSILFVFVDHILHQFNIEFVVFMYYILPRLYQNLKKVNNINEMGNRNTTHFQTLKELPTPLSQSQCVLHKYEILICGGYDQRACYSYHTLKNEYKFICKYPIGVGLYGHCVVKL